VAAESFTRKWSDTKNWPDNKLPALNANVVIPPQWRMVLDVDTPVLD
jgi:hypothetical protein